MSAKWVRSKQWDDQHIPAWAWPLRFLLRTFSGIPLPAMAGLQTNPAVLTAGKNLFGEFWQPRLVAFALDRLVTLPVL